jgi:hypothetical protein
MQMEELKPKFNFSNVNRQWSKQMGQSIQKATRAQITLSRPVPTGVDSATVQAHFDAQEAALDVYEQLADEQAALIAQVLVDVPREWLLANSPEIIDWSDPASFDFIQEEKYGEILALIQSGEARTLAKN